MDLDQFYLDRVNECLRLGSKAISLRPKVFALLNYLLHRPGLLVTKEQLIEAVWPGTFVGESVLKNTIFQLREALDDDPKAPRFIETVHRRGYRFIGQIAESNQAPATLKGTESYESRSPSSVPALAGADAGAVGREGALARLRDLLEQALRGRRQIVFVTGEAGIGKTFLVDTFARGIAHDRNIRLARGQCLEHYGTGEAYLPVLEAVGRLCKGQAQVIDVLRSHAPMWLLQMTSLLTVSEREALRLDALGASRERMLREMGEALEALTADLPMVLILEDLHWSDRSTLDLISYLARQRDPAQLMLIGTYRPPDMMVSGHPLKAVKQELLAKQQCEELPLEYLSEDEIAQYLSARFSKNRFPAALAKLIHERTEGNPLFLVNAVDYLVAEGSIGETEGSWELMADIEKVEVGVPDSVKQMIEKQLNHLDPEQQRTLEEASVAGVEFTALGLIAESGEDQDILETRCHELARRRQFIQDCGSNDLPNGEVLTRYGFIHSLYQNVLYERVSAARRIHLHRRLAEREEEIYGERVGEIAAELAMHFERGAKLQKAVEHLQRAAENDIRRFAYREAVVLARRGLELLEKLPDTTEHAEQELLLHLTLGVPLIAIEGYAAPDVGSAYRRARELCERVGVRPEIEEVLWGLWLFHLLRAEMETIREIAEEFLRLAEQLPYSGLEVRGHFTMGVALLHQGQFAPALEPFDKAFSLYDPKAQHDEPFRYSQNLGVGTKCRTAWTLWFLGQPDQALERIQEAVALARELGEPHVLAHTFIFAAIVYQLRREARMAQQYSEASIAICRKHEIVLYEAMATIVHGWALSEDGKPEAAIEQMRDGLAAYRATGTKVFCPHFLALLAGALGRYGHLEEGLLLVEEALAMTDRNGDRYYEAELYRLKGELLVVQGSAQTASRTAGDGASLEREMASFVSAEERAFSDVAGLQAEACFRNSIRIAQQQEAKSWELRSTMNLTRLYRGQGRMKETRGLLEQIYKKFNEGFDTADLCEAKALLDGLS